MEYLSGGALSDIIEKLHESEKKLRDIDASKMVKEILEAVAYLHDLNTVHRDLKPGNLPNNRRRKYHAGKGKGYKFTEVDRFWSEREAQRQGDDGVDRAVRDGDLHGAGDFHQLPIHEGTPVLTARASTCGASGQSCT